MPTLAMAERASSPVSPVRTTSIRKLTKILRPARMRRAATQPVTLSIPGANMDRHTPPSSPSLYSLSSESGSRSKLLTETDRFESRPLLSPTSSTFSSSASEEHGDNILHAVDYATPDLGGGRAEPISPTERSLESQWSPTTDHTWAANKAYGVRPHRIITADKHDRSIDSDTSSLRTAGKWGERAKLQPLSPSEWIGSNVQAKRAFGGVTPLSPSESENRSPFSASSSSSPVTPRPRPVSEINLMQAKLAGNLDIPIRSQPITEIPESELLTESRRRPRSASEPRSFLASPSELSQHAGTVPSTPTEYILTVPPELNSGPKSSQTISPPPRQSSLPSPITMPDDVYFTAAGRRESRLYAIPDAAPNYVPPSPMRRGHAHSSSEPVLLSAESDQRTPPSRYATWNGKKKEPTSGRPFEDLMRETPSDSGDSTPVSRKEDMWSGNWNRDDIRDVIRELRSLK